MLIYKKIQDHLKALNEALGSIHYKAWFWLIWIVNLILSFLVYFYGQALILNERPNAGTFDLGFFEIPLMVLVFLLIYKGLAMLFIHLTWPSLFKYYLNKIEGGMRSDISKITPLQRIWLVIITFFAFYFSFLYLSGLLISGGPSMPLPAAN